MTWLPHAGRAAAVALLLVSASCDDLSVPNLNDPDRERALAAGDDLKNLVAGSFSNWYFSTQDFTPAFAAGTMADHMTASWGNFGMRHLSSEPRVAFVNLATDGNIGVVNSPWYDGYAALVGANLALVAIRQDGIVVNTPAETKMVETASVFLQGAVLSNMSLFFDKGFAVDESVTDPTTITFSLRGVLRDSALSKLDQAIALAGLNAFTLPTNFLNITGWTNTQLAQVANTIAARTIAYYARTPAENTAAAWSRVLSYAAAGISSGAGFDPSITGDNNDWYDSYKYHGDEMVTWTRVDQRVVCLMDATQPCRYPSTGTLPRPTSADARMALSTETTVAQEATRDFVYRTAIPFSAARGVYHYSHIGHRRYLTHARLQATAGTGVVPFIIRAENDLLWAEALIRTGGDKALAAQKINNTRVGRGQLSTLTGAEADQVLLDAVFYERDVEMFAASALVPLYDMRRTGRMQVGTPFHFPVPARELEVLRQQLYTFGGPGPAFSATADGGGAGRARLMPGPVVQIAAEQRANQRRALGISPQ